MHIPTTDHINSLLGISQRPTGVGMRIGVASNIAEVLGMLAEVSIIIRLFTSIIVYINYNIIKIEIEASIIYIDYINYINIYKGVGRGRSCEPGLVLSEDFRDHRQLYRCQRQEANILV